MVYDTISAFHGRELKWESDDSIIGVFDDPAQAIACAIRMQQQLLENEDKASPVILRTGISASQPVTADGDFFKQAIKLSHRLSRVASPNQILISSLVSRICTNEALFRKRPGK